MYLSLNEIKTIHLEFTSLCNAACPQCARGYALFDGKLPLSGLSFAEIQRFFPRRFLAGIDYIFSCGNFGDPIMSEALLPSFDYFRSSGVKQLTLNTNGSLRPPEWWRELAGILRHDHDHVVFSIDGLQDTNHLYRRNCKWEKIMASAEAYIAAGGKAEWHFLVFRHNQHQVDQARELAYRMGFKNFAVKKSARHVRVYDGVPFREEEVFPPDDPRYAHETSSGTLAREIKKAEPKGGFLETCAISCQTQRTKEIYVDFEGDVWPCCYLATRKINGVPAEEAAVKRLLHAYGEKFLSLRHHDLQTILQHEWYQSALEASWERPTGESHLDRQPTCSASCNRQVNLQSIIEPVLTDGTALAHV